MSSRSLSPSITPIFNPSKWKPRKQAPNLTTFVKTKRVVVSAVGKKYKGTVMREEKLAEMIEKKVAEAMEACDGDEAKGSDGCKVAWDEVEEVSQAKADWKRKLESDADPLESFCGENPEIDECSVYSDDDEN